MSRTRFGAALLLLAACTFEDGAVLDAPPADAPLADAAVEVAVDAAVDAGVDAGLDAAPDAARCAADYVVVDGTTSRYRFVLVADDWLAAELDCEDDSAGSHLVVLDGASELAALDPLVSQKAWIGMSDRFAEGFFFSVTGGVAPYQPFQDGEPNNDRGAEDCAELDGAELNDEGCGDLRAYVCECDGVPALLAAYTEP